MHFLFSLCKFVPARASFLFLCFLSYVLPCLASLHRIFHSFYSFLSLFSFVFPSLVSFRSYLDLFVSLFSVNCFGFRARLHAAGWLSLPRWILARYYMRRASPGELATQPGESLSFGTNVFLAGSQWLQVECVG